MTTQSDMHCTVCREQKLQLRPRKSKLMKNLQMYLCNECFTSKREPRFAIIMVGRKDAKEGRGLERIEEYLRLHRYVGEDILAKDLV